MFDFYFYLTASIGVILFGIAKGGFAGPASILAIPIMSLSMSPATAAGILLPIILIMDFIAIYLYWKTWDLKNIKLIIFPAIIGIIIGFVYLAFKLKSHTRSKLSFKVPLIALTILLVSVVAIPNPFGERLKEMTNINVNEPLKTS